MRESLGMSPGKLAAQAAHAAVLAYDKAPREYCDEWNRNGVTKIVLGVWGEDHIVALYKTAVSHYLPAALVCDEGRTEVPAGSITAVGIGPAPDNQIDEVTGHLHLYGKETTETDTV